MTNQFQETTIYTIYVDGNATDTASSYLEAVEKIQVLRKTSAVANIYFQKTSDVISIIPTDTVPVVSITAGNTQYSGIVAVQGGTPPFIPYSANGPLHGQLAWTDLSFQYTPTTGYSGSDSFDVFVSDSMGVNSSPETVSLFISAPPVPNAVSKVLAQVLVTSNNMSITFTDQSQSNLPATISLGCGDGTTPVSLTLGQSYTRVYKLLSNTTTRTINGSLTVVDSAGVQDRAFFVITLPSTQTLTFTGKGAPTSNTPPPSGNTTPPSSNVTSNTSTPPIVYNVPIAPNIKTSVLTHSVHAEFTDAANTTWTFDTYVGEDPTQPGIYGGFVNANGDVHPGVVGKAYADCFEAGAMRMDNGADYLGCTYAVSYDGVPLVIPFSTAGSVSGISNTSPSYIGLTGNTVDFWCGCCMPAIRYGNQISWSANNIDWSILPSYGMTPAQSLYDDSKYNYTMNGLGCATTWAMGNTGERADIGFLPAWDVGFLTNPSDASWAVVRRASDFAGQWRVHYVHPETGRIVKIADFPQATYLPPAQTSGGAYDQNPIKDYVGSYTGTSLTAPESLWKSTASPNLLSMEHPTAYCFLSAMITRTARDLDHASYWGNYAVLGWNPYAYAVNGVRSDVQRAFAWNLRSLFLASYYSSDTDYFAGEMEYNLTINNAWLAADNTNQYGLLNYAAAYKYTGGDPLPNPDMPNLTGVAVWQHSYIMLTMDAISHKDPRWLPFHQYVGSFFCMMTNSYLAPLGTNYTCMLNLNGQLITGNTTLEGLAKIYDYSLMMGGKYNQTQADAMTANTNTVQDTYNAVVAANEADGIVWSGQCVNNVSDMIGNSQLSPDGYPSLWQLAVTSAYNANTPGSDTALAYIQAMPTKTNYTTNNKYHLQPRK